MSRSERTVVTTSVQHIAEPLGRARENGPHLVDLREFVAECDGLPGDLLVRITDGHLNEGGRRNVTLQVTWSRPPEGERGDG